MKPQGLEEMQRRLLFHNTIDIWRALCRERGWEWRDGRRYLAFVDHLKLNAIPLAKPAVQHVLRKLGEINQVESYSIRLDDRALSVIRAFTS